MNAHKETPYDPIVVYQCGTCCEEYETRGEAKNCCVVWICGECCADHETKAEANACCKSKGGDA